MDITTTISEITVTAAIDFAERLQLAADLVAKSDNPDAYVYVRLGSHRIRIEKDVPSA